MSAMMSERGSQLPKACERIRLMRLLARRSLCIRSGLPLRCVLDFTRGGA